MDFSSNLSILIPNHNERLINEVSCLCEKFYPKSQIIIQHDFLGRGKGWAIREALKSATRDIIVIIDGDLDIYPLKIHKLIPYLSDYDIVIGTKEYPNGSRKKISFFAKRLIKFLFRLPVSDTQTGLKLFKRKAMPSWETNGFLFDVEILCKAHQQGFKIKEIPLKNIQASKKKGFLTLVKCLWELLILKCRLLSR